MQNSGYVLPRISIPRTRVNKVVTYLLAVLPLLAVLEA
jgi:hypothetical protein